MLLELCPSGRIFLEEAEILGLEVLLLWEFLLPPPWYAIVLLKFGLFYLKILLESVVIAMEFMRMV